MKRDDCVVCGAPRTLGVLCAACAAGLVADDFCREQIGSRVVDVDVGGDNAWLIDGYGVPHVLSVPKKAAPAFRSLSVGRSRKSELWIAERTVSLAHALFEHRPLSNAWFVVDVGSDNGVFVNDDVVAPDPGALDKAAAEAVSARRPRRFPLEAGDRIFLGRRVGFVFLPLEDGDAQSASDELRWLQAQSWSEDTVGDAGGLDLTPLKISAVTEGGAVAVWGGERISLSELEYELVATLHRHMHDDGDKDEAARGWVPAAQLLQALSFRSEAPTHTNLRGLVRKLRRKFADRDNAVDLVESRQGLGYRLARPLVLG